MNEKVYNTYLCELMCMYDVCKYVYSVYMTKYYINIRDTNI